MDFLFTALMVLSHFDPYLPKLSDYQTKSKPELVQMYSFACRTLFAQPEFKDLELQDLLQNILSGADFSQNAHLDKKINMGKVIELYTKICKTNPDPTALDGLDADIAKGQTQYISLVENVQNIKITRPMPLPESTEILDRDGKLIAESYQTGGRRKWVSINALPTSVPLAFVSVEDRRFFEHKGADEIGILRAVMKSMISKGRPEGGSTITQQVARNLFLDSALSLDRKLKEILIAEKLEATLSKREILELYMNLIYFGRNSWGIHKAAESYFGKSPSNLTIPETAYLVGIVQGPNLYQTDKARIESRVNFVLSKFVEEKIISVRLKVNVDRDLKFVTSNTSVNSNYFRDYLMGQLNNENNAHVRSGNNPIVSTLHSQLQKTAEAALQNGLISYEKAVGRYKWRGPITNIAADIKKNTAKLKAARENIELEASKEQDSLFSVVVPQPQETKPAEAAPVENNKTEVEDATVWTTPLFYVSQTNPPPVLGWRLSVALDSNGSIGFSDGTKGKLSVQSMNWISFCLRGDVQYVVPSELEGEFEVIQSPKVNGAVVVMAPRTGEILSMVGGFSYQLSQWNRAVSALRQPGSLIKPMTYMAALQEQLQPNLILKPGPFIFPPSTPGGKRWMPENYDDTANRPMPMRWALENSINTMTAYLLSLIDLEPIRRVMKNFGLYENPGTEYPIVIGSQETNLLNLVKVYGEIANEGKVLTPNAFMADSRLATTPIEGIDEITLFQTRYLLQGVIERGTAARRLGDLAPYIAGKTGTSNESKDVWFIAFTPNLVVGAYVGYDKPRSLGSKATSSSIALPIVETILRKSFEDYKPKEAFRGPPPGVIFLPTDRTTGEILRQENENTVMEAYRANQINMQEI